MISRGRYCLCVLRQPPCCAASTLHALHEAPEDRARSTTLLSWARPALGYKVCLHRAFVYANVYWAEASPMACNTVFCSFVLQLFDPQTTWWKLAPGCLREEGELACLSRAISHLRLSHFLFLLASLAPELLKELFLLLLCYLAAHLEKVVVWCCVGLEVASGHPRRQTSWAEKSLLWYAA